MRGEALDDDVIDQELLIGAALPPVPGDSRAHLLPTAARSAPVRVRVVPWLNSRPTPDHPETLWVYRGSEELGSKQWTAPIPDDDLFVDVDMSDWEEGEHALDYRVQLSNGEYGRSRKISLWIDLTAPVAGQSLIFPGDLAPTGTVTAHYLETHGDEIEVEVLSLSDLRPSDTLQFYWSQSLAKALPNDENWVGDWVLSQEDLQAPKVTYAYQGQVLRDRGDGTRYAYYRAVDRAGNEGSPSWPSSITVAAAPVPRDLPPPSVTQGTGTPPRQSLDPSRALQGVTVEVPPDAVIYEDEAIALQWGVADQAGSWTSARLVATHRPWLFAVPSTAVAAHLSNTLPVTYTVYTRSGEEPSTVSTLAVSSMRSDHFPMVRCREAEGFTYLSLARIPANGATLILEKWALISTDQRVRLTLYGTLQSGGVYEKVVVDRRAVTQAELATGITQVVPKADIALFLRNNPLRLRAYVSWDRGATWPPAGVPNFPVRELNLID